VFYYQLEYLRPIERRKDGLATTKKNKCCRAKLPAPVCRAELANPFYDFLWCLELSLVPGVDTVEQKLSVGLEANALVVLPARTAFLPKRRVREQCRVRALVLFATELSPFTRRQRFEILQAFVAPFQQMIGIPELAAVFAKLARMLLDVEIYRAVLFILGLHALAIAAPPATMGVPLRVLTIGSFLALLEMPAGQQERVRELFHVLDISHLRAGPSITATFLGVMKFLQVFNLVVGASAAISAIHWMKILPQMHPTELCA